MTDQEISQDLKAAALAAAEKQLADLLDRSAATALHTAAVMARNTWIETFNRFSALTKDADCDALCVETARQLTELNRMVERSAALTKENKA